MTGSDFQSYLQLANRLRQLSDDVDDFCTDNIAALSEEQIEEFNRSSEALEDAYHVLIGADLDARLQAAKPDLDRLKQITADTQTAIRKVKAIDAGIKIAIALAGVAVGIVEKDPGAIKDAAGDLMAAIQPAAGSKTATETKPADGTKSDAGGKSQA